MHTQIPGPVLHFKILSIATASRKINRTAGSTVAASVRQAALPGALGQGWDGKL